MRFFLIISLFVLAGQCVESAPKNPEIPAGNQCLPGSSWKSQCNDCVCNSDGMPSCTLKSCPGYENEPEKICAPDTVWKYDCNTCWCSSNGQGAMCTLMGCFHI